MVGECFSKPSIHTGRRIGLHVRNEAGIDRQRNTDAGMASPFAHDLRMYPVD